MNDPFPNTDSQREKAALPHDTSEAKRILVEMIRVSLTCTRDRREKAKQQVIDCEKRILNLKKSLDVLSE